ncbi:MAG: hypothetical protein B5M53_10215 [Candidatus Cloacimonas sp. 4484_209]|nr:MAG: hypothetical protein B5M53_10215 [Candidatus Cloacimonas sp. 4484_209]
MGIVKSFEENPQADLVFGNIYDINEHDRKIGELRFTKFNFSTLIYESGNISQPAAFWKREIYNKIGGINIKYEFCMDFDLFCRIGEEGCLVHIREPLASFRINRNAKSIVIFDVGCSEHEEIVRRYLPQDISKLQFKYKRLKCCLKRAFRYIIQGDVDYVLRGVIRKLLFFNIFRN